VTKGEGLSENVTGWILLEEPWDEGQYIPLILCKASFF
jgi:hypothetical protein